MRKLVIDRNGKFKVKRFKRSSKKNGSQHIPTHFKQRSNGTPAEIKLKSEFEKIGIKFEFQHKISLMTVDFFFPDKKLVIEIDGDYHCSPRASETDSKRDSYLHSLGFKVFRFKNNDVFYDIQKILNLIQKL